MILLVVVVVTFVAKPFIAQLWAERGEVTELKVEESVAWLTKGDGFGNELAAVALERTREDVTYVPAYYKIAYPNGDVPAGKGV